MTATDQLRDAIRFALRSRGVNQSELAERVGCTRKHVSSVLLGKTGLSLPLADHMMEELGYELLVRLREHEQGWTLRR